MATLAEEDRMAALAMRFTVLTARSAMVLGATWQEVDLEDRLWVVPKERIKGKRGLRAEFRAPLSSAALDALAEVKKLASGPESPVFPSPQGGGFLDESVMRVLRDEMEKDGKITLNGYPHPHITVHGFRSTFRDWCENKGKSDSLAEAALAHRERDKVVRAYRRTDALERRRVLMEEWGTYCTSPPKVVPLKKPAA